MDNRDDWKALGERLRLFTIWVASAAIDAGFIIIWVYIQLAVEQVIIPSFGLSRLSQLELAVFQVVLGLSTLAPICTYVYMDIRIMFLRAQRRIRGEMES